MRHTAIRTDQHHFAILIGHTKCQNFRHEGADLAGREVDHRHDLAPQNVLWLVVGDELRPALERAFSLDRPVVIDVVTDMYAYAAKPKTPSGS